MKRVLLTLVAVFALSLSVKAQGNVEVGAAFGFVTGDNDVSELSDVMIAIDGYYMFKQEDAFINLGPTVGFRNYFTKDIEFESDGITISEEIDNGTFITVGGAARLTIFGTLRGGADAGYAIGLTDIVDGGFYFRPIVGLDILDTLELNLAWESIWDEATWSSLQIGAKLEF